MKRSILTEKVARRGYHVFREYTVDVLERVSAEEVMTKAVDTVSGDKSVEEIAAKYFSADQKHLGYRFVRRCFDRNAFQTRHSPSHQLREIPKVPQKFVTEKLAGSSSETKRIADIMAENNTARVPVVDPDRSNKLIGLVTFNDLLKPYAAQSKEENLRERFFKTSFSAQLINSGRAIDRTKVRAASDS